MKNKKSKTEAQKPVDEQAVKFINALADGKNVDAYKLLEKMMRERVASKIDDAMRNA